MKGLLLILVFSLCACAAKAPDPVQPKGDWHDLNTTYKAIQGDTY